MLRAAIVPRRLLLLATATCNSLYIYLWVSASRCLVKFFPTRNQVAAEPIAKSRIVAAVLRIAFSMLSMWTAPTPLLSMCPNSAPSRGENFDPHTDLTCHSLDLPEFTSQAEPQLVKPFCGTAHLYSFIDFAFNKKIDDDRKTLWARRNSEAKRGTNEYYCDAAEGGGICTSRFPPGETFLRRGFIAGHRQQSS